MPELRQFLAEGGLEEHWPWGTPEQLNSITQDLASASEDKVLAMEYQRLFCGPESLTAPPWGSVYLDQENVLWGDSTLQLIGFCEVHGIELASALREPPDQFGLICSLLQVCAEMDREKLMHELLAEHLLPWSERYLTLFNEASRDNPFYRACGNLARLSLKSVTRDWSIEAQQPILYF